MNDIDDLLGIPFKLHGRDISGYDCYGLVIEVERRLGHKMVDLYTIYESGNNEKALDENVRNIIYGCKLVKATEPKFGDILFFYDSKYRICHIGVLLEKDDFIHCDADGVKISQLSTYFRKSEVYTWQY